MATKRSNNKGTSRTSTASRSRSGTRKTSRKPQPQRSAFELKLAPEHQRELFALVLLTIALATMIFFMTGIAGGIGEVYMIGVQQAFGRGALVVPLALGLLGIAILIQERFQDAKLTGNNVFGTLLVLAGVLALLEFPVQRASPTEAVGTGGGLVGYVLVNLLSAAIGRPVTFLIICMLTLFGLLLTFNLTLRELLFGVGTFFTGMWQVAWSGPRREPALPGVEPLPASRLSASEPQPYTPPPTMDDDDIIATPIAERTTRASLFRRPEGSPQPQPPSIAPAVPAPKQPEKAEKPVVAASAKPAPSPAPAAQISEMVQESLDGWAFRQCIEPGRSRRSNCLTPIRLARSLMKKSAPKRG